MDRHHHRLVALFLAGFILAAPAEAKEVTITLSDQDQQTLVNLLDAAVRSGGLQYANAALLFVDKIQAANQAPAESVKPAPNKPLSAVPAP